MIIVVILRNIEYKNFVLNSDIGMSFGNTNFSYYPVNGIDLNDYKRECHLFVFNCPNTPDGGNYGFLDVSYFNGTGFHPGAIVRQTFTNYSSLVTYTRFFYVNESTWTEWINDLPKQSGTITESSISSVGILQTINWEKYGRIVCLTSQENVCSDSVGQYFLNLTLPEHIRPLDYKACCVFQYTIGDGNSYIGRTMIYPDGRIRYSVNTIGTYEFRWTMTYLID